jgi:hypothetical protein
LPFVVDFPSKNGASIAMLVYQRVPKVSKRFQGAPHPSCGNPATNHRWEVSTRVMKPITSCEIIHEFKVSLAFQRKHWLMLVVH